MGIPPESALDWSHESCQDIGIALLAGEATARELADAVGGHRSNVKKRADAMVVAGLLVPGRRLGGERRRGTAPATYALSPDQHEEVAALAESASRGLPTGQHAVFADARSEGVGDLFGVVAESRAAARATGSVFLAGERPEYAAFFDADDAVEFAAALVAAGVQSHVAVVGPAVPAHEFVRHARRAGDAAHRTGVRARTRRAASGERPSRPDVVRLQTADAPRSLGRPIRGMKSATQVPLEMHAIGTNDPGPRAALEGEPNVQCREPRLHRRQAGDRAPARSGDA